jgi:hypothetical protein
VEQERSRAESMGAGGASIAGRFRGIEDSKRMRLASGLVKGAPVQLVVCPDSPLMRAAEK